MARLARADLFDPREISVLHCLNRCVRQAFLCGDDPHSGRNYDHRKIWLECRLKFLAAQFGVDVIGFAIMSNHFHLVLRNRPDVVAQWSDSEVARRWLQLCPRRKTPEGHPAEPTAAELDTIRNCPDRLEEIRLRLSDISWLMRMIAEPIARRANREDQVTGHFWEGRFKAVKLCDEAALLACLAYVDLNPIRAGIALTPESSNFTSIGRRIEALLGEVPEADRWLAPLAIQEAQPGPLASQSDGRASDKGCLPLSVQQYMVLLDWTGRQLAANKAGTIPPDLEPILDRLGIAGGNWLRLVGNFGRLFYRVAGAPATLATQHFTVNFRHGHTELLTAA